MASNKNQHFVPRCHLRPFTLDGLGKAVHVFNLDRNEAFRAAPVKGQCSGDYFYGENPVIEALLQRFEGQYGARTTAICAPGYSLIDDDAEFLRNFWRLQFLRTEAASRRAVEMLDEMGADLQTEHLKTSIKEAVEMSMLAFLDSPDALSDLKVRLVRNRTDLPLITSDNPAVMTNRWHLTDRLARGAAPGLNNAGMIGLLPLSPDVLCVLYDGALHSMPHRQGWVDVDRARDVEAFNEQQVLNCQTNLYFLQWASRQQVADLVARVGERRPESRHKLQHLAFSHEDHTGRVYRPVTAEEAAQSAESIVHTSIVIPQPSRWPSVPAWRPGGTVYDSGTGSGFVRGAFRDPGRTYKKVKVRS